jgi:hypothetical protein
MIRGRVIDVEKRFARDRDYMLLANFEPFGCFETERKALHRPAENSLPNLTPLWTDGNFGANRSHLVAGGVLKLHVNVAVRLDF